MFISQSKLSENSNNEQKVIPVVNHSLVFVTEMELLYIAVVPEFVYEVDSFDSWKNKLLKENRAWSPKEVKESQNALKK